MSTPASRAPWQHIAIAVATLLLGAVIAWGATGITSEAGYAGVGPNFLPWVVAVVLLLLGAWLLYEALSGGFRQMDAASGAAQGDWVALAWVAAGVILNAALITRIGFILACTLCFVLAVRGLRGSEGKPPGSAAQTLRDAALGALIAAPTFWVFTKVLGINLPGLTGTGWL